MIHIPNGSTRRIMTCPAVRPCESVAPATLLDSLIDMGCKIQSYKLDFFASNKRNIRKMIREMEALVVLFEEMKIEPVDLSQSTIVGLSELHLTFQKVRYLLEDCTKDGARLWMVVNSGRVLNQVRILGRAVGSALDVLPRGLVGGSGEAEEVIELILRQNRKSSFELDGVDGRVLEDVKRILGWFENGVVPDPIILNRVLDFLGIRSWSDCNKEVRFLESELHLESSSDDKSESAILSSLIGLVTYSRCVLFDVAGGGDAGRRPNSEAVALNFTNSDDLHCPISLELMTDPVTISTGHTYDRCSIQKWLTSGNPICPKTGERLKNTNLIPNLALRRLIHQYCSENNIPSPIAEIGRRNRDVTKTALPGSPAAEGAIKMAANNLASRLRFGSEEERSKSAYEVRAVAKASIFNRACLVESGTVPYLLNLLSSSAQENAIAALLNLSKHPKARFAIVENNGLDLIVGLLQNGLKVETCHHAAATLFYLASDKDCARQIGEIHETMPGLLKLIKQGSNRGKKNSLAALLSLLSHPLNHSKVLAAGTVPILINLMTIDKHDLITDCLAVLAFISKKLDGSNAVLSNGGLDPIMEVLSSSASKSAKEHCASILLALCVNGEANVIALLGKNPSLMASLYLLLSDGTPRASRKATALIRILHQYFEGRSSSEQIRRVLPRDRAVHAW